jgi:hypothetical protein
MAMTTKEKLLLVWTLAVVAFSIFFRHFWSCTVDALEKAVALGFISLPGLAKLAAGIFGVHFLP